MSEIEMSEISYTAEGGEGQEMDSHIVEQNMEEVETTTCVIVGTVVDPTDTIVPTTNQNFPVEGYTNPSVAVENVGDVPVKFEIPENVCVGSINGTQFTMFEGTPETTVATCIAQPANPTYSLENFTDSEVKVEPVDHNAPVPIFKTEPNVVSAPLEIVTDPSHSNGQYQAIPVTAITTIEGQLGVLGATGDGFPVLKTSEASSITDEQFESMGPAIIQSQGADQLGNEQLQAMNPTTSGGDGQFNVAENPPQVVNAGEIQAVASMAMGQLAGVDGRGGQFIPVEQLACAVTEPMVTTASDMSDNQFQVVTGMPVSDEQIASMENAANNLTDEQMTTLSTPEGLINVVQSLGDVQSVEDGQFTLVTPDGLLSVVNPNEQVSTDGPINVTTENGIQYAILSTPEGLVKVALNAPEGITAGVLVADENGQLVLQNVSGDLETDAENAVVQLPVQYADPHDQAVLQANGLVLEETTTPSSEAVGTMPPTNVYAEAVSSGSNVDHASMVQPQQVVQQEQPQIEPECFEVYTVEGAVSNQEQVMSNPPEAGMVEVVSYTSDARKDQGQPGPSGYAMGDSGSGSEPEFVSVEPPSIATIDENACVLCGKKFPLKEDLTLHLRLHARESVKTHDCRLCDAKFSRCWLLRKHYKAKHPGGDYSRSFCADCGEVFESKDRLCSHMWKVHKQRNAFPCNCLDSEFNTAFYLRRHEGLKYCPVDAFFCNCCNERFDSKESLTMHMEETDDRLDMSDVNHELHICQYCKRGFNNSRALARHLESHKDTDRVIAPPVVHIEHLTCHKCGEHFRDHSALTEHTLRTHVKKKPAPLPETYEADYLHVDETASDNGNHGCNICGGRFESSQRLNDHLDAHITGIIDRAGRWVKSPPLFQGNAGAKQCPYCKKDCHTLKRFNNHYCVRPGTDGRYPCMYCTKIFTNLSSVYSHLAWHRREEHQMLQTDWPEEEESNNSSSSSSSESEEEVEGGVGEIDTMFYTNKRGECKCTVCGQKFRNTSSLQVHMTTHKKGSKRQRNVEEEAFRKKQRRASSATARSSSSSRTRSRPSPRSSPDKKKLYSKDDSVYKCKVCDKVFVKFLSLCGHLATHRNDSAAAAVGSDSESNSDGGMVIDFDSALSNFAKREKVQRRHSPVPREVYHECDICGKIYTRLRSLSSHKKLHGEGAKLFACVKCGAKFSSQESLLLHKQACRYEKQICSCVKCGGKFPNFGELKDHLPMCLGTGAGH